MNATVSFGPTHSPVSIETLADCRGLQLSNLPSDTSVKDLQVLVQPYAGSVVENSFRNFQRTASVQVDFINAERAKNAFDYLHLRECSPGGRRIIASFVNVVSA